jgi:hypothetical protein
MVFSPKSQKMLFMNLPVSGAEGIFPFIFLLAIIYFYSFYSKKMFPLTIYILSILLLILSITHYHPQWFLWATPFLIWELVENNFENWLLVFIIFMSWVAITLFFEPSLSVGLFSPLNPDLQNAKGLTEIFSKYFDVFQIKSIIRSVFAAASTFYLIKITRLLR